MDPEERRRIALWGVQAQEARPFLERTLSGRYHDLSRLACRPGANPAEREGHLTEMRVILDLLQRCGTDIIEAWDALKVDTNV